MYVAGFVIPVPEEKMEAYRKWAEKGAAIFREYGCSRLSILERITSPVANIPTSAAPSMRRMARRLSSRGKCGPTRRPSIPPKRKCTRTRL
jgi:uncharacterized protein YbaA (DUF1428 family)